ncbi:MAG: phosphoglucosamine mutase [Armatimonadota bacterium]|nr:phosphoglucosamine mutase [Armatimonadota bacterium]
MGRLFGTDGIRGVANETLTPEMAFAVGRAAGTVLARGGTFVVGRDTRVSGPMLEAALVAALCSVGARVVRVGIMPTPAVAYLVRAVGADAGVVVSASHNPVEDNGIKFLGRTGQKLPDAVEDEIERAIGEDGPRPVGTDVGVATDLVDAEERYLRYLVSHARRADGLRVVVDCGFGAAYRVAPQLWTLLGSEVIALNDDPHGTRINVGCGSTSPEVVASAVRVHGADIGFTHDGDADRVIAVDENGAVVDGDLIMTVCARHLARQGVLQPRRIVATVMTNLGVERALREDGIEVDRAPVGDRYVLERMLQTGAVLGGEQSGHIIFRRLPVHGRPILPETDPPLTSHTPPRTPLVRGEVEAEDSSAWTEGLLTGDGLMTAVQLLNVVVQTGLPLSRLVENVRRYPQVLVNVRVGSKDTAMADARVREAIAQTERAIEGRGRLLVRPSGTEPVVRVMVEHEDEDTARRLASDLAEQIASAVGPARP